MSSFSWSTPTTADSALAMAKPPVWSKGLPGRLRLLLALPGSLRVCHPGPGARRLVAPLAGVAGGPLREAVREAGVRRAQPERLPVLRRPLQLEVKDRPVEGTVGQLGAAVDADGHLWPERLLDVAQELRIFVQCQAQLCHVAPDPHRGGLRRGPCA